MSADRVILDVAERALDPTERPLGTVQGTVHFVVAKKLLRDAAGDETAAELLAEDIKQRAKRLIIDVPESVYKEV